MTTQKNSNIPAFFGAAAPDTAALKRIAIFFLVIVGLFLYANTLQNEMFWDDNDGIINNSYVHNFQIGKFFSENLIAGAGFESNYWRPLLLVTYSIEWMLWGDKPFGYHFVNTAIHTASAVLVFLILSRVLGGTFIPFFTSLIFLIHPLQTEAVTYISGRGDPLSFLFMILGIMFYLRISCAKETHPNVGTYNIPTLGYYFVSILMFVLALLTKERSLIFPAFILLIEVRQFISSKPGVSPTGQFVRIVQWGKRAILRVSPFALIAIIYIILRATVLNFGDTFNIYETETAYTSNILSRAATFLSIIPKYILLAAAPIALFMERSEIISVARGFLNPYVLTGVVFLLLMIFVSLLRNGKRNEYAFGTLWFLISMFAISGIAVPLAGIMFEHYMYIPLVGLSIFAGAFLKDAFYSKFFFKKYIKAAGIFILLLWVIFLGVRTVTRNADWREPIHFYEQTLRHAPTSMRVWNNLGMEYSDKGFYEKSLSAYARAMELDPANPIPYHNSGNIYELKGEIGAAKEYWQTAVKLNPRFIQPQLKLEKYEN